jgi:hypothetical protein
MRKNLKIELFFYEKDRCFYYFLVRLSHGGKDRIFFLYDIIILTSYLLEAMIKQSFFNFKFTTNGTLSVVSLVSLHLSSPKHTTKP